MPKKIITGKVVSDSTKRRKTIAVLVETWKFLPKYKTRIKARKKYHAHDEKEEARVGDLVQIQECRPYSKTKKFKLIKVLKRA